MVRQAQELACTLNGFDCIVATTSGIAFALALCRKKGQITVPIVAIQCGLLNYPYNYLKTFFTGMLLPYLDNIFFGQGELYPVGKKFPSVREQLSVCQYGIDTQFWCKADRGRGDYILSVGNDGRRDFDCLLAAAKHISCEIKILTARPMPDTLPDNVTLLRSDWHDQRLTDTDLRKLYQEAMCVVLPIVETFQPSGQSVALQAMACGTAVVITETLGFWEPDAYRDGENILYCRQGDPEDLAEKVNALLDSKDFMEMLSENGWLTVNKNSTIDKFSACIELHCLKSL
ncbi:MAG: glycosyltransferase family 4 protein [Candidatus Electrothrix gigas]